MAYTGRVTKPAVEPKVDLLEWEYLKPLADGTYFPQRSRVAATYPDGLVLDLELRLRGGPPAAWEGPVIELVRVYFRGLPEGAQITPALFHEIRLGHAFGLCVEAVARAASILKSRPRVDSPLTSGRLSFPVPLEAESREGVSRRGRPVGDKELREVAKIVAWTEYAPRNQVQKQLHVSARTASRWIKAAHEKGFVAEEQQKKQGGSIR